MTKNELAQSAMEDMILKYAVENEAGGLTVAALCTAAAYVAHLNATQGASWAGGPVDSLAIGEALTTLLGEYNHISDGPRWDEEPVPGNTQAEVDAFAEASVDAAMARAHGG